MYMRKIFIIVAFLLSIVFYSFCLDTIISPKKDTVNLIDTTVYSLNSDSLLLLSDEPKVAQVIILEKNSDSDKILNYILPIITLILGIFLEKLIETYNTKKKVKKTGKRWNAELQSLKLPIQNQIENFNNFNNEYGDNVYAIPNIVTSPDLKGDNLKSLDKSDLLEYIDSKNKIEDGIKIFNRATGVISILDNLYNNLVEKVNEFKDGSSKHIEYFNNSFQKFVPKIIALLSSPEDQRVLSQKDFALLLQLYNQNIEPHLEESDFNPLEMEEDCFKPVIHILLKYNSNPVLVIFWN